MALSTRARQCAARRSCFLQFDDSSLTPFELQKLIQAWGSFCLGMATLRGRVSRKDAKTQRGGFGGVFRPGGVAGAKA